MSALGDLVVFPPFSDDPVSLQSLLDTFREFEDLGVLIFRSQDQQQIMSVVIIMLRNDFS